MIGENGQLFGWSEATWLCLDQFGILVGDIMLVLSIVATVWAFWWRDRLRRWLLRGSLPVSAEQAEDTECWDGLLFTVSRPELPEWVLESRKPRTIALLATTDSKPAADAIVQAARKRNIGIIGPALLADPDDPAEARDQSLRLLQRLRESGQQHIAVDVTGGKTPMSIGAFLAAGQANADVLYVVSEYDRDLKKPDTRSARIRCISRAETS